MNAPLPHSSLQVLSDLSLDDKYTQERGRVYMSGIQALVRLPMLQHTRDALDGLRGLGVLIVLGSHLSNAGFLPQPGLSGSGKSGVYLFFTLSAFLLTRALLRRPLADFTNARRWADYALRRVLRIWPLYLALLLCSWALTRAGVAGWHYQMDTGTVLRHLALREWTTVQAVYAGVVVE